MHSKSANSKDRGRYNQQLGHLHHLHGNELRQKSDASPFLQPTTCADYDATAAAFSKYSCWWCFENVTENMNNNYVLPYVGLSCQHFCTTQTPIYPKITKFWWHCFQVGKHYLVTPAGFLSHCPWVPRGSSPILTRSSPAVSLSDSTSKSLSIEGKLSLCDDFPRKFRSCPFLDSKDRGSRKCQILSRFSPLFQFSHQLRFLPLLGLHDNCLHLSTQCSRVRRRCF